MNTRIARIARTGLIAASALLLAGCFAGCTTVTKTTVDANGVTNIVTSKVPNQTAITIGSGVVQSAVFLGSDIYLNGLPPNLPAHPEAREYFEDARDSLHALIAAGTFNAGDLTTALSALPIKSLQSGQGQLIIGETVTLWSTDGQLLLSLDKNQDFATFVLPFAKSVAAALDQVLGPNQVFSPAK